MKMLYEKNYILVVTIRGQRFNCFIFRPVREIHYAPVTLWALSENQTALSQ